MPPDPRLFEGRAAILRYFEGILGQPSERRIRLAPASANGQPAFIVIAPEPTTGVLRRVDLKVLMVRDRQIAEIRGSMRADLAARFDDGAAPWRATAGT